MVTELGVLICFICTVKFGMERVEGDVLNEMNEGSLFWGLLEHLG